jgi:dihydroflavonol-4-reductase
MESVALRPADGGVPAVVVIPTVVFGPGDVHMTVARYLLAAARGTWISVTGEINVVDVRDVAEAQLAAAERGRPGERYLLGGENISIRGLLQRVAKISGRQPPKVELPLRWVEGLARLAGRVPGLGMLNNHLAATGAWQPLDSSKARRELAWSTRALEETLRESLAWLESQGHRWRR